MVSFETIEIITWIRKETFLLKTLTNSRSDSWSRDSCQQAYELPRCYNTKPKCSVDVGSEEFKWFNTASTCFTKPAVYSWTWHSNNFFSLLQTITLKMAYQGRSELYVVLTVILCGTNSLIGKIWSRNSQDIFKQLFRACLPSFKAIWAELANY